MEHVKRLAKVRNALVVLAATLVGVTVLGTPAIAAPAAQPNAVRYFTIWSFASRSYCAQEVGSTSGVFLDPCDTSNSSDLWYAPANDSLEIKNKHSGLCLSVSGLDAGVYLHTCQAGATAQEWIGAPNSKLGGIVIAQEHSNYFLWQSNKSLQQRVSVDLNSVHDTWGTTFV
jgi:hypothetical protein